MLIFFAETAIYLEPQCKKRQVLEVTSQPFVIFYQIQTGNQEFFRPVFLNTERIFFDFFRIQSTTKI